MEKLEYPKISVTIVTWNTCSLLKRCLNSIEKLADTSYELFVIDNNSTMDDTKDFLKNYIHKNPKCIRFDYVLNKKGMGFAYAVNQGLRKSRGEYMMILNSDTEITSELFSNILKTAEKYTKLGIMGIKILNNDGSYQKCVFNYPTLFNLIGNRLLLAKKFPNNKFIQKRLKIITNHDKESIVEFVKGVMMFMPRKTIESAGYMDEEYFLWFEETDYCQKIKKVGLDIIYAPQHLIYHTGSAGISKMPFWEKQFIYNRSIRRYFRKHHGYIHSILAGVLDPIALAIGIIINRKK